MNRTHHKDNSDLAYWTLTVVPVIVLCMTVILTIALRLAVGEFKCRHCIKTFMGKVVTPAVQPP